MASVAAVTLEDNLGYWQTLLDHKLHVEAAAVEAGVDPGDIHSKSCHLEEDSCQIECAHK